MSNDTDLSKRPAGWSAVLALVFLLAGAAGLPAGAADSGSAASDGLEGSALAAEEDDELDIGDVDDGSSALMNALQSIPADDLRPIGLSEEKALLGNWGDAEDEDED